MKWGKERQRMALKLQDIERARKSAAEARLLSARAEVGEAQEASTTARSAVEDAERGWSDHLSSKSFNLELGLALAAQLLENQHELERREQCERETEHKLEQERHAWQKLEASVRSGDHVLRRGRREIARRAENARDHELSEQTTWKWFRL